VKRALTVVYDRAKGLENDRGAGGPKRGNYIITQMRVDQIAWVNSVNNRRGKRGEQTSLKRTTDLIKEQRLKANGVSRVRERETRLGNLQLRQVGAGRKSVKMEQV